MAGMIGHMTPYILVKFSFIFRQLNNCFSPSARAMRALFELSETLEVPTCKSPGTFSRVVAPKSSQTQLQHISRK